MTNVNVLNMSQTNGRGVEMNCELESALLGNITFSNVVESSDPNPWVLMNPSEAKEVASKEKRDELLAIAPCTGITTSAQYVDLLADLIIRPAVFSKTALKIETKHMNFFNIKKFNKDGSGRDYKRVASPFLFTITDINNYVILSNVPNIDTLNSLIREGFIAMVKVGEEIVGIDEVTGKNIMKDIMVEKLFKYVATSASKQRQERYIFTSYSDREMIRKMLVFFSNDFDFGTSNSIAKVESRIGQNLSTGICIGGAVPYELMNKFINSKYRDIVEMYYVLIPDMFMSDYKLMNGQIPLGFPEIKAEGKVVQEASGDYAIMLGDGSGLHTEAVTKLSGKRLNSKTTKLLQHRLGKGTTAEASKLELARLCKYLGIKVNLNLPIFFITEGMWKFEPGIELLPVVVLRASEELSEYASMCYETWNALNISGPNGYTTLKTLAKREFDMFNITTQSDPGLIMHRLGVIAKMKDVVDSDTEDTKDIMTDETLATGLFRMFAANPFFARRSEYLMVQARNLFARKIADMARGKILVKGSFCIMQIDPGAFHGRTVLKKGQCYVGGRTGKCVLARYPMVYPGEPQVMEAIDCPELARFKGLNIIIMNIFDSAWEQMQGADFDGDACLVCFEESVIALAVSGTELVPRTADMLKNSAPKAIVSWDSISEYFLTNFRLMHPKDTTYVPTIGKVNNIVAALLASSHADGSFLTTKTMDKVEHLALTINDLIDAAKTGIMPQLEHSYFDAYKIIPNFLAKSVKDPITGKFTNTWEIATVDQNPESMYYLDTKSPLGILCNEYIPELFKQFTLAGDKEFSVDDFLGMYNGSTSVAIQNQVDGIRKDYTTMATLIFNEKNNTLSDEEKTEKYKTLCVSANERIRKVAASFDNDINTVAIACLISGGKRGFAFKCFEEGVISVFEKMEGVTLCKAKGETPAGSVVVSYDGVRYFAQKRASKDVQYTKFVACDVAEELTIRLVGLQYHGITSMNDLKSKIIAAGKIITGGKDTKDVPVAMVDGKTIGKVSLTGSFSASSNFVLGGVAQVISVNFVMNTSEKTMSYDKFLASKQGSAVIKSADLVVRYLAPVDGIKATTAVEECSQSSNDGLPTMGVVAEAIAPSFVAETNDAGIDMSDALLYGSALAQIMGLEVEPVVIVEEDNLPDPEFMSLMDSYFPEME